jgi:hypothetical protein
VVAGAALIVLATQVPAEAGRAAALGFSISALAVAGGAAC